MQNFYDGREQSEAKHEILRRYLIPFSNKILRTWPSVDFIDGFSGPWENNDTEDLRDTSIGIALRTLSSVAEELKHSKDAPRIRCIFNEADPDSYRQLQEFLDRNRTEFPLIEIRTFQGKFADNAPLIKAAATHAFQLLFVDPTGYTGFPPSSLSLFKGRSSEVIVNFMRSFIMRFVSGDHRDRERNLIELLGEKRAQYLQDTGITIRTVEDEYLSMLRGDLGYRFAGFSPIHNPDRNEIHFNLAYATNHPAGMDVMRTAEFSALTDHDRKRFMRSIKEEGGGLFGDMLDEMEIQGPYLTARKEHSKRASNTLEDLIADHPSGIKFSELSATAQQTLFLKQSELGDVLVEMSEKGIVQPTWLERGGRKPTSKDKDVILPS